MKNSTFGFLTALALTIAPTAAFAQSQTSIQTNGNSASAVGDANLLIQNATQKNSQAEISVNAHTIPSTQLSVQGNNNAGAAVGHYNVINQNATQNNAQTQIDATQYFPTTPNYNH